MSNITASSPLIAYFSTESAAEKAVGELRDAGFTAGQIGIATRSGNGAGNSEVDASGRPVRTGHSPTSAGHESAWQKFKNFFNADSTDYSNERAHGAFVPGEAASASGDYDSDYSDEDFQHSLSGLSVPADRSRYFNTRFRSGEQGSVITVSADGRNDEAERILKQNGGDLGENASSYDYSKAGNTAVSGQQRIQLLGEVLRIHKDRVTSGEVRLRKEVVSETRTIEVPVSREELVIERTVPTGGKAVEGKVGENAEIHVPLTEEVVSVDKDTFVREEVSVGKREVAGTRSVGDTVSHEELVVENPIKRGA